METLKKLISSRFFPIIVVVIFGFLAGRPLLKPGYFIMHDDLQMMRQLEMEKCFQDGQIPCRWVPDMGFGFGFPLFNYYPPLPYLIGQGIRLLGFSFVDTVKITFFLSFIFSGLTMYLLAKTFWGRLGGVLSAVFYIWAPYHAVDIYVRGAMNESWALVWFPLIFWASYKLIIEPASVKFVVILALSWAALFTSHNIMVLIFTPVFAVWCLMWLHMNKKWTKIPQLLLSGIWSLGLAAFFTIPVVLEKSLVQVETLTRGYYEYVAHFATLNQLFISRFWGYGESIWEANDGMPFPIGHLHWILALFIGFLIILKRKKLPKGVLPMVLFLLFVGFSSAFMAHSRSTPIWLIFSFLEIVQFPWRFLTLVMFSFSFLVGVLVLIFGKKQKLIFSLVTLLTIGLVFLNKDYFLPYKMGPLTDAEKFKGVAWELQQRGGILDYLPKSAKIDPPSPRKNAVDIIQGKAEVREIKEGTNWISFNVSAKDDETKIRINTFEFPDWKIFVDSQQVEDSIDKDENGRIHFAVNAGDHKVEARLFNTLPRILGNVTSIISWVILVKFLLWKKIKSF